MNTAGEQRRSTLFGVPICPFGSWSSIEPPTVADSSGGRCRGRAFGGPGGLTCGRPRLHVLPHWENILPLRHENLNGDEQAVTFSSTGRTEDP